MKNFFYSSTQLNNSVLKTSTTLTVCRKLRTDLIEDLEATLMKIKKRQDKTYYK